MHYYSLSPHDASPEINTHAQNACKPCRFWKINHRTPEHLSRNRKIIQCSHEKFCPILRQIMGNSRHKIPSSASRNKPKIPSSMPSKQSMHGIKESPRHHVLNSTLSARESKRGRCESHVEVLNWRFKRRCKDLSKSTQNLQCIVGHGCLRLITEGLSYYFRLKNEAAGLECCAWVVYGQSSCNAS